jgi:hypothetical protein
MEVIEIGQAVARDLIMTKHYAHRMPTIQRAFGLMEDGSLVGCVTFGQPASPNVILSILGRGTDVSMMELNRLVITTKTKNAASFLVGGAIRRLPKTMVLVSYADKGVGHVGYVYQATNWHYWGETKERTDMASESGQHSRHSMGDPSKRVNRSAKHRYWLCRDKKTEKMCKWQKLPYPKGETKRHDFAQNIVDL